MDPGLRIGITDDYPMKMNKMRKGLLPVLKKAKREKASASFSVDRLVISGQIYR